MFFSESFKRDSYAVAETLLKWRDDLIEAGWDGLASADDTARIQDTAAVEARTRNRLSPGTSDRLRFILLELNRRSPNLDLLTVRDPQSHLPKLCQLICAKLGARYEPVAFNPETNPTGETSDLGRIQSLLREDSPTQRLKLNGDHSILCVTAFSEITLAHGTAQLLQHLRQVSNAEVTIVAAESASPLEQSLSSLDEPTVGFQPGSTARPIPQVLLLALVPYWKPVDPRALLEFLAHPACPVAGVLRFKLANVIADCPGVGGPQWKAATASTKESIENSGALSAVEKQEATNRIEQDLKDWLLVAEFDAKGGASGSKLSECCAQVARWAALQSVAEGVSIIEAHQFRALASLSSEMAELLRSQPAIARSQLERLLHQVSGTGWPGGSAIEELSHNHRVAHPSAVSEPVDNVLWWNFSEPLPPVRLPWTTQELEQLRVHGVEFPTPETLAAMEAARWLRPILEAKKQLILVYPRERAGEPVAHHPLLTRLVSLLHKDSKPLPVVDLDHLLSTGKADAPWHFVQVNHIFGTTPRFFASARSASVAVERLRSSSRSIVKALSSSRWPISSGGGLQSRKGWCNSSTGFHFFGAFHFDAGIAFFNASAPSYIRGCGADGGNS